MLSICLCEILLSPEPVVILQVVALHRVSRDKSEGFSDVESHHFSVCNALFNGTERRFALLDILHHLMTDSLEHVFRNSMESLFSGNIFDTIHMPFSRFQHPLVPFTSRSRVVRGAYFVTVMRIFLLLLAFFIFLAVTFCTLFRLFHFFFKFFDLFGR